MEGHLLMSRKELQRKSILELVQTKRITLVEAAERMNLSYRQTLRVYKRFVAHGDAGLVHRRRGMPSNRRYPPGFRKKVVKRYKARYGPCDMGPTLAAEKLAEEDGLNVDHETLRRWLLDAGEWKRRRKSQKHRSRRERRAHFGELVQMDGSHHNWFGPGKEKACLMNMVDDATGRTLSLIDEQETTVAAMTLLRQWIELYGIPKALYTDKKNVYVTLREPTLEEQLANEVPLTAFGKSCKKLGIEVIMAHSPQAKGRVERSNGTYQDRLVKELALRRITTITTANNLLQNGFTDDLNDKFAIAPRVVNDYHTPVPSHLSLDDVFCFEECRVLQNDWCVRHENRYFQIIEHNKPLPKPKDKIVVRTHLDGRTQLLYRDKSLAFVSLTPKQLHQQRVAQAPRLHAKPKPAPKPNKPAANHPWRQRRASMKGQAEK